MLLMRWFALIVGTIWTLAVVIQMIGGDAGSGGWQQAAIGVALAGSGLYGLLRPDRDE